MNSDISLHFFVLLGNTCIFAQKSSAIPDAMDDAYIYEIKNVKYLSNTRQLKTEIGALEKNQHFRLYIRKDTRLSKQVQEVIAKDKIIEIKYIEDVLKTSTWRIKNIPPY